MSFSNTDGSRVPVRVPKPKPAKPPKTFILKRPSADQQERATNARQQQLKTSFHQGGDIKGAGETQKAESFKHTKQYVRDMFAAVKANYDQASPAEKKRIFGNPTADAKKPGVVQHYKQQEATLAAAGVTQDALEKIYAKGAIHPALWALEKAARPQHVVAGTADAIFNHKNLLHEAGANASGKEHTGFADVLAGKGHKPSTLQSIAGFGLDVVSDPLNYVTFGAATPEQIAARGASRAVLRKAPEDLARAASEAAKAGAGKATNRGFHVSLRVPFSGREFSTSGKATSFVSRHTGIHQAAEAARNPDNRIAHVIDKLRNVAPDLRPSGEARAEFANRRNAERDLRAQGHRTSQEAAQTSKALKKAAVGAEDVRHIERAPVDIPDLTTEMRDTPGYAAQKRVNKAKRTVKSAETKASKEAAVAKVKVGYSDKALLARARVRAQGDPNDSAAVIVRQYDDARRAHSRATQRLSGARKGWRNAHVNRGLYTDSERAQKTAAMHHAEGVVQGTRNELDQATALLRDAGERGAARHAARDNTPIPADMHTARHLPIDQLDRRPSLRGINNAEADAEAARAELRAARAHQAIAGPVGPRREQRIIANGQDYLRDVRPGLARHEPHTEVQQWVREQMARLGQQDVASGALEPHQLIEDPFPHTQPHELERGEKPPSKFAIPFRKGAKKADHLMHRKYPVSVDEAAQLGHDFSTSVAEVMGRRILHGKQRNSRIGFGKAIIAGRPQYTGQKLADTEGVYKFNAKTGSIDPVDRSTLQAATDAGKYDPSWHVLSHENAAGAHEAVTRPTHNSVFFQKYVQGPWKTAVTQLNPSYHVGNEIGNRIMAWQADTTVKAWSHSHRMITLLAKRNKWEKSVASLKPGAKFEDTLDAKDRGLWKYVSEAEQHGALSSGVASHELQYLRGDEPSVIRKFGERRENQPRLATYLSARQRGMTPSEAANWTNKHHIDYGDLSPLERKFRDRGIPFYTFTARNTRLQVEKLLTRPNKAANFELTREDVNKRAQVDPGFEQALKRYQQAGMPFVLRFGGTAFLLMPKTPIDQGLSRAVGGPGDWLAAVGAAFGGPVKTAAEEAANYSTFRRQKIAQNDRAHNFGKVPAPPWLGKLASQIPVLGHWVGVQHGQDGQWWINAKAAYAIAAIPQTKVAYDVGRPKSQQNPYGQTPLQSGLSIFGAKLTTLDPKRQAYSQSIDAYNKADKALADFDRLRSNDRGKAYYVDPVTKTKYAFNSEGRQKLVDDRSKKLKAMELLKPDKGPTTQLEKRPPSLDQTIDQRIKKAEDRANDPDAIIRQREREMARRLAQLGLR